MIIIIVLAIVLMFSGLKGVVDHSVVGSVDWLPTVLALVGIPTPPSMLPTQRGYDLSKLILNSTAGATEQQLLRYAERPFSKPLLWEWRFQVAGPCINGAPQLAARVGRYKLLLTPPNSTATPPRHTTTRVELYDFGAPAASGSAASNALLFEAQNVAALHPDIVANLSAPLLAWHAALPRGPVDMDLGCAGIKWPIAIAGETGRKEGGEEGEGEAVIIEDDPLHHL